MPIVPINAMVVKPKELGKIPLQAGLRTSICRDLRRRSRTAPTSPPAIALVNGKRAVYILVTKRADASTLAVVNEIKNESAEDAGRACPTTSTSPSSSTSRLM